MLFFNRYILIACCLFFATTVFAQNYVITGTVTEEKNKSLPSATIALLKLDSTLIDHVQTSAKGRFVLRSQQSGNYLLKFSFVGYETQYCPVVLSSKHIKTDIGTILLRKNYIQLGEVQVASATPQITVCADTLIYQTSAFRLPPGATLGVLIKQMPGLQMDKNGDLTFQGKKVAQILVDGKVFFGNDIQTPLANMPAEAIQKLKAYDKISDYSEFTGVEDGKKETVLDLIIKKEYRANWMVTVDVAAGTKDRYLSKFYLTRFTDQLRVAIYGNINNISSSQIVNSDGNWYNYNDKLTGLYTYRSAGMNLSWDNGKKRNKAGYLEVNTEINASHNNNISNTESQQESFVSGASQLYGYSTNLQRGNTTSFNFQANLNWCPDSNTSITIKPSFTYNGKNSGTILRSANYNSRPSFSNPLEMIFSSQLPDSIRDMSIYSKVGNQLVEQHSNQVKIGGMIMRKLNAKGRNLRIGGGAYSTYERNKAYCLTNYKYYQQNAAVSELLTRQYERTPENMTYSGLQAGWSEPLTKKLSLDISYTFEVQKNLDKRYLYQLDSLETWRNIYFPVNALPSTADSLAMTMDHRNSYYSNLHEVLQNGSSVISGNWRKIRFTVQAIVKLHHEKLKYQRADIDTCLTRSYISFDPTAYFKYKFVKNGSLEFNYNGTNTRENLVSRIPVTDNSNPMNIQVSNPNLKSSFDNNFKFYIKYFDEKHGFTYYGGAKGDWIINSIVNTARYDTTTGGTTTSKENVNGVWNFNAWGGMNLFLDKKHRLALDSEIGGGYSLDKTTIGSNTENEISTVRSGYYKGSFNLKYRIGIWSVGLSGSYLGNYSHYQLLSSSNEKATDVEWQTTGQISLPSGFKLSTDIGMYCRFGYLNSLMNRNQLLWNAQFSQSFLKKKNLTLQLELVDILHNRSYETSQTTAISRYSSSTKTYLSYGLFHILYRFNIKANKK